MSGSLRPLWFVYLLAFTTAAAASADRIVLTFEGIQSGAASREITVCSLALRFVIPGVFPFSELDGGERK